MLFGSSICFSRILCLRLPGTLGIDHLNGTAFQEDSVKNVYIKPKLA